MRRFRRFAGGCLATLALAACACFGAPTSKPSTASTGPAEDPADRVLLLKSGIAPDAEGLLKYFATLKVTPELLKSIEQAVRDLGDGEYKVRERASAKLSQLGPLANDALEKAAAGDDAEIRARAKELIDKSGQASPLSAALRLACRVKPPGGAGAILGAVPACHQETMLALMQEALLACATPADLPVLRASMKNPDPTVRRLSVRVLAELEGPKAADDLAATLADTSEPVALEAAKALAGLLDRRCLAPLGRLMASADVDVRAQAGGLVEALAGKGFGFVAYESDDARKKPLADAQAWIAGDGKTAELHAPDVVLVSRLGRTLLCLPNNPDNVIEFDAAGGQVFKLKLPGAWGCQGLPNGHRLITTTTDRGAVIEYDADGKEVWKKDGLDRPQSVQRLADGNTLIACLDGKVLEFTPSGKIAWQFLCKNPATDAKRLANGRTMIVVQAESRVFEVDRAGKEVWKLDDLKAARWAQRLPNGNTLVAVTGTGGIVEMTPEGKKAWSSDGWSSPKCAQRLPNGRTLVTDQSGVWEVDKRNQRTWQNPIGYVAVVCRY